MWPHKYKLVQVINSPSQSHVPHMWLVATTMDSADQILLHHGRKFWTALVETLWSIYFINQYIFLKVHLFWSSKPSKLVCIFVSYM